MAKKSLLNKNTSEKKQTAVKQTAVKQTAVKQTAVKKVASSNKTKARKFYLEYFVKAITPKEEDFSGATIIEWFDTGRDVDAIACPYDYKKTKSGFEVIWQGIYDNIDDTQIVEEAIDQIKYWANDFDATFKPDSHILLKDSKDQIIQKFIF